MGSRRAEKMLIPLIAPIMAIEFLTKIWVFEQKVVKPSSVA